MKRILLWVCALTIILGAALTVYAAPGPEEAPPRDKDVPDATDQDIPPVAEKDAAPVADEAARETDVTDASDVMETEDVTDVKEESLDPRDYFEVNELGLTYGYAIYDNVRPDLAAAIGTGGVHGYVYWDELLSVGAKRFPEDIVTDIPSSIPLYASDGVTVIGEFPIGGRTDDAPAFNVVIEPYELLKSDTAFTLEEGRTVRIFGAYTPIFFDLVFGLVDANGNFYGAAATGGTMDQTIPVPAAGTYYLAFRNPSDTTVRATGYVYR